MYLSWFLSIKLPLKEFSCLKISSSTGWTIVLIDWIQDLDTPRKILNISYIDSLRKTSCFCHVLSLHILVPSLLIFQIYSTKSCNMVFYENLVLWEIKIYVINQDIYFLTHVNRTKIFPLHEKWSFPLKIFSLNVTKFAVSYGFGHIYWGNPYWKTSFFVQCL